MKPVIGTTPDPELAVPFIEGHPVQQPPSSDSPQPTEKRRPGDAPQKGKQPAPAQEGVLPDQEAG